MKIIDYPDRDMLAIDLANVLAEELENALFHKENVSFSVPGGGTPGAVFDSLCAADLDWARITVLASDERWVPADDERSNERMIRERLLTGRAAKARFLPFFAPYTTPDQAVLQLTDTVQSIRPLDVLLLGMGSDAHIASIFPRTPDTQAALASDAPPVMVQRPDTQPELRLTLTAPVLNGALSKHLLITGDDKHAALEQAAQSSPFEAPVRAIFDNLTVHWAA